MNYFRKQNDLPSNRSQIHHLELGTLTIINGLVDFKTQGPSYSHFSRNNTYGREVNDTIADYMEFSLRMKQGCLELIDACETAARLLGDSSLEDDRQCNIASAICQNAVELVYLQYAPTNAGPYDIRDQSVYPQPPAAWPKYLNVGEVQQALGVDTNYPIYPGGANSEVLATFWFTGDVIRSYPLSDLEELLDSGTRVALIFGDADYLVNWYGGEALSLTANFSRATGFQKAGYAPLMVNGKRYGDTREYGKLSFTRVFDAGHMVPFYQPEAALAMFNRTIRGLDIATGEHNIHANYSTLGAPQSTYSQKNGDGDRNKTALNSARFRL